MRHKDGWLDSKPEIFKPKYATNPTKLVIKIKRKFLLNLFLQIDHETKKNANTDEDAVHTKLDR
ncbi:hypothetical protein [[Mycoplasma] testudinis]|uniref:hypothetical protein n=1 Tax=[Mycoplasma] testudinis TaxID=33924 RepID=UPI0012EC0C38|nr:hypothetical protein [[Mycoplasma] testudinis]